MKVSLTLLLTDAVTEMNTFYLADELDTGVFLNWIDKYPAQLVVVAVQIIWTQSVDKALTTMTEGDPDDQTPMNDAIGYVLRGLEVWLTLYCKICLLLSERNANILSLNLFIGVTCFVN